VKACTVCGFAVEVVPVALLVDGRVELELRACGYCRGKVVDAIRELQAPALSAAQARLT
jgi:hypothetical protein